MGKYKRTKGKKRNRTKHLNSMSVSDLYNFIVSKSEILVKYLIIFNVENIEEGDQYYSESGKVIHIKINDSYYRVGYVKVIEDDDNWGQAESYFQYICSNGHGERVSTSVVYNQLAEFLNEYS